MLPDARRQDVTHPAALAGMWRDESGSRRTAGPSNHFQDSKSPSQGHLKKQSHQKIQFCCRSVK
jgi:hypothetical protein